MTVKALVVAEPDRDRVAAWQLHWNLCPRRPVNRIGGYSRNANGEYLGPITAGVPCLVKAPTPVWGELHGLESGTQIRRVKHPSEPYEIASFWFRINCVGHHGLTKNAIRRRYTRRTEIPSLPPTGSGRLDKRRVDIESVGCASCDALASLVCIAEARRGVVYI